MVKSKFQNSHEEPRAPQGQTITVPKAAFDAVLGPESGAFGAMDWVQPTGLTGG